MNPVEFFRAVVVALDKHSFMHLLDIDNMVAVYKHPFMHLLNIDKMVAVYTVHTPLHSPPRHR